MKSWVKSEERLNKEREAEKSLGSDKFLYQERKSGLCLLLLSVYFLSLSLSFQLQAAVEVQLVFHDLCWRTRERKKERRVQDSVEFMLELHDCFSGEKTLSLEEKTEEKSEEKRLSVQRTEQEQQELPLSLFVSLLCCSSLLFICSFFLSAPKNGCKIIVVRMRM